MGKEITYTKFERAVRLLHNEQGLAPKAISKVWNIPESKVKLILKKEIMSNKVNNAKLSDRERAARNRKIKSLKKEGYTLNEIASLAECSSVTVQRVIKGKRYDRKSSPSSNSKATLSTVKSKEITRSKKLDKKSRKTQFSFLWGAFSFNTERQ